MQIDDEYADTLFTIAYSGSGGWQGDRG